MTAMDVCGRTLMAAPRPGGRSARVRAAVLDAAGELLVQKGPHGVTMPEVAQRAGVAVTSLYRRWGDVASLLMDLAVERITTNRPLPDTGTLEGDLKTWARSIAAGLRTPEGSAFFKVLVATAPTAGTDVSSRLEALGRRREQITALLDRAKARGEATPAINDVLDHLLAPIYMRALWGRPRSDASAEGLVDRLLG